MILSIFDYNPFILSVISKILYEILLICKSFKL